jgi:hypothetical protein
MEKSKEYPCYSTDLEHLLRPMCGCLKGLVATCWRYWEVVEPLEDVGLLKKVRSFQVCPWMEYWEPDLSSILCFLATMGWAAPPMLCHHHVHYCLRAKQRGTKPSETMSQGNLSSFSVVYIRFFCTMMESWLTGSFMSKLCGPQIFICHGWAACKGVAVMWVWEMPGEHGVIKQRWERALRGEMVYCIGSSKWKISSC